MKSYRFSSKFYDFSSYFGKKPVRKRGMFGEPKIRGYFREGSLNNRFSSNSDSLARPSTPWSWLFAFYVHDLWRFSFGGSSADRVLKPSVGWIFIAKTFFFVCMSDVFFRRFECWGKHVENCMTLACMHVARESTFFGEKIKHVPQEVMHVEFPDMHKNPPTPQGTRRKLSMSAEFAN